MVTGSALPRMTPRGCPERLAQPQILEKAALVGRWTVANLGLGGYWTATQVPSSRSCESARNDVWMGFGAPPAAANAHQVGVCHGRLNSTKNSQVRVLPVSNPRWALESLLGLRGRARRGRAAERLSTRRAIQLRRCLPEVWALQRLEEDLATAGRIPSRHSG